DAETPGVAVPLRGVDASVAEHLRVHHAAPTHLEPPFVAAALASDPAADPTRHVELEARLREGEVARTDTNFALASVERLDHVQERALHVADREAVVDRKPFHLAEVRKPRRLRGIAPVHAARRDDVDRRVLDALHGAYLHRRRVRAQQQVGTEVEGVPALTRRMTGGEVQRLEVVPLSLNLGPELDLVAERLEHGLDLPADLRQDVDVAAAERG